MTSGERSRTTREGDQAPDFKLQANNGQAIALQDLKGKNVVIYFYPKDDTPGCTVEACGFRDSFKEIEKLKAVVLGVSPNNAASHEKFIKKFNLPFTLLADTDKKMCQDYGVWVEKSMYGKKYMGVARTTFVIDKDGKVAKIFEKVKPEGHHQEVIETLKAIK
ncbi:MAG: thioredoxin-dependent thiol peroxidase [Candidatus Omnitrophica bacterium]|nr:thioredoxin-dependent thiol peroxidase [Candidatus Omnitrophota bacterium]